MRTLILIKQNVAALRDLILIKLIFCTAIIVNGRLETVEWAILIFVVLGVVLDVVRLSIGR